MVAQMSKNSKIYHRDGCRYIDRIHADSLITFDFDDGRINELKPCEYCCSLKMLYKKQKPKLRKVFTDLDIATEFDGQYVLVHTAWYDWSIRLKKSSQYVFLYRKEWNEEIQDFAFIKCEDMEKTRRIGDVMNFIANEEKLAVYPKPYRMQAFQMEQYAREKDIQMEFDEENMYVLTDMAAWKITYGYRKDCYKLWHCPFNGEKMTMEEAKEAYYHRQMDVSSGYTPYRYLQYIVKHDAAKKISRNDYRKLPQSTKQQKKYYRQAQKKERRKSIDRVLNLLAELEKRGEVSRVAFG